MYSCYNTVMHRLRGDLVRLLVILATLGGAWAPTPVWTQVVVPAAVGGPGGRSIPSPGLELVWMALAAGEFSQAVDIAVREHQAAMRSGTNRWIDSIATAAATGECHYESGSLREAVAAYDEALLLAAAHAEWMLAVQFPPQGPRPPTAPRVATWGRSQRNTVPATLAGVMTIRLGGSDPQEVLQKGGVLAATVHLPIRPQEIVRAITMAAYRRGVILGELGRDGTALDAASKALSRRPAPPNHYSQCWIDVALGTLLWSQGRVNDAQPLLLRGIAVGNQFDHPLSCWGLIVLGRIALASDQFAAAARYFEEATFVAADYGDTRGLEEAFRLAATAHLAAGTRGVPASIRGGREWSRSNLPVLHATLLGLEAEALAVSGDVAAAGGAIGDIDGRLLRGEAGRGTVGIQQAYAAAVTAYAAGDGAVGDRELDRGLGLARRRSPALFQASRLVEMIATGAGGVSDRQADLLFAKLLGDPTPGEVAVDPLGSLASVGSARTEAFEAWVHAAFRRGGDASFAAVEAAVRSRWLAAQPCGGRRAAVESLLAADPDQLAPADATARAGMLARFPELAHTLNAVATTRTTLTAKLLAGDGIAAAEEFGKGRGPGGGGEQTPWREYQRLADRCRASVVRIAAGRTAPPITMLPLTPAGEIRRRLEPKQLILSFHWTSGMLVAALESRDRFAVWQVRQPAAVAKEIAALTKAMCVFDAVAPVPSERLLESDWRLPAERLERLLFENSKVVLSEGVEELIVVPDGMLWYLPFELLPVGTERPGAAVAGPARQQSAEAPASAAAKEAGGPPPRQLLRDVCRIRYAPSRSLAVLRFDRPQPGGPIGVHAGRLYRGDRPAVGQESVARLTGTLERAVAVPGNPLVASLCETLVVLDEIPDEGPVAMRPLFSTPAGKPLATFADWLAPPTKRPRCLVLPGFQSAMADGLLKPPARPGEELFAALTDLIAAGCRTAVVSRWRVGGETCIDLVEEFLRDRGAGDDDVRSPPVTESWERAVDTVIAEQPEAAREPRLKQSPQAVLTDARHPFFWAGYMLVDCGGGRYEEAAPDAKPGRPAADRPAPVGPAPANPAGPAARPPANPAQAPLNPLQPRPPQP